MSDIEDFADWLVANQALKGTPRFKAVADAFTELDNANTPVAPVKPADTGFTGAFRGAVANVKGEAGLTAAKVAEKIGLQGLWSLPEAERYQQEKQKENEAVFKPTTEGWGTAPWQKFKETLGGSLPNMVAPIVGAVGATLLAPELAVAGLGTATLGSLAGGVAQFTGSGLARQMGTGKTLEETNLGYAVGAAIPSAALDTISLRMTPFLGQLFKKAGIEVSEKEAQELVKKNLLSTVGEYAAQGVKLAGIEGATEAGQAVFERLQAGLSITDKSAMDEYIENFIGGAVLGGALGTAGHAASKAFAPKAGEAPVAPSAIAPVATAPVEEAPVAEAPEPVAEAAPVATPVAEPETEVETPVATKAEVFTVEDPVAKAGIHKEFNSLEEAEAHVDNLAANRTALIEGHQDNIAAHNEDITTLQQGLDTEIAKGNYGTPQFLTHEANINNEISLLNDKIMTEQAQVSNLSQPVNIVSPTNAVVEVKAVEATPIAPAPITPAPAPLQAVTEPVTKIAQVSYAPDLAGKMDTLRKTLLPTLKKFGLDKVGLRIVDSIANGTADASYVNQVMKIAYDTEDHMGALRHESIHALKELGAFANNEWKVLSNKAKTEWIDKFIKKPNLYNGYKEQHEAAYGSLDGFDAYIQEEAIAEAFRHFAKTKPPAGLVGQLYGRLNNMFQSLGNSFKSLGYTNADDIFQKIERGEAKPTKVEKVAEKPVKVKKAPEVAEKPVKEAKKVVEKAPEVEKAPVVQVEKKEVKKAPKAVKTPEVQAVAETPKVVEKVAEKPVKAEPKIEKAPEVKKAPVKVKKSELESLWNSYRRTAIPFSTLSKEDVQLLAKASLKDEEAIDRAVQKIYKGIDKAPTKAESYAEENKAIAEAEVQTEEETNVKQKPESLLAYAAQIKAMPKAVREDTLPRDFPGGHSAYLLYEAQKLLPKPSDKLKKLTGNSELEGDFHDIANVDGHLFGINRFDDADESQSYDENKSKFVFAFTDLEKQDATAIETTTKDVDELFAEIRQSLQKQSEVKYQLRSPKEISELSKLVTRTEKFKRWFRKSEIVNKDGTPKVMYHGTARDITEFRAKQAGAIFLTDDPNFAESFSDMSEHFMINEAKKLFPDAEWKQLTNKATAISKKEGTSYEDELRTLMRDTLPSNANIMPVYVSAQNVFDFQKRSHLNKIDDILLDNDIMNELRHGDWETVESAEVQAAIRKAGFDGFYVMEGGKKNLAVYTSNQIKSAIGNNGEFDINNPDIRYKLRAPVTDAPPKELTKLTPAQTMGRQIKDAAAEVQTAWHSDDYWTKLRQAWVDPSSALAQRLSGKGAWDLKGLRADMLHRAKSQIINIINNGLQIGTAKLNKDGSIIIERSDNNLARSQILADKLDANKFVQATGLSGRKFVSEIARRLRGEEIIADDTKRKAQAVKDLAEARKMFKDSKDLPYKEKAKLQRAAANLRKQAIENKNINRELQVTPEDIAWAKKQLQNVPEVEEVFDIWRNVNNSLLDLWHDTGLLNKTQVDEYRSKKRYVPMFASKEDLNEQMFGALGFSGAKSVKEIQRLRGSELDRNIWENMYKNYATKISAAYENQTRRVAVEQLVEVGAAEILTTNTDEANLRFKDYNHPDADANGVVHALVYNTNDVLAFQNMHYELIPLMKGFSKMTNLLRTGALLNPMFWIRQLIRDPIHAAIVTDSGIVTPFHAAKEFINILKNDSREFSILFERGVVGPRDSTLDYHDYLTQIGQEKGDTSTFRNAFHKIEMTHEASDAATRVSIFKDAEAKALKQGMSKEDAINFAVYKSRESINFSVHGNGKMLNNIRHMIPFFSASITSLDTLYRAATGYGLPPAEKAAAQKMFKQRAGAMIVMSAAYAMMMQGDDDYKKLPDHVKDGNWLVPNPLGTGFIKIAVPFEVGFLFKTIPETAVRYMAGTSTGKEVLASYQAGIIQNMPGNLVPLPQAVRPLFEAYTNYSFFTRETIETAGDSHLPTAFRGANASELSKVLSKFGLDSIGLSPTKIDYLMQGFMAELGITGMALASQAVLAAEGKTSPDTNLEKLPFFKAFMTDPNADKAVSDFYKIEQNAVEVHTQFQKMLKSGMGKEAIEYLKEGNNQKIIAYEPSLIKMSKQLGTIRAAINITTNNESMSPEDRRLQINNLKKVYNNVADAYAKVAKSID